MNLLRVIHCSKRNWRNLGDAIEETGPEVFRVADAIYGWWEGVLG